MFDYNKKKYLEIKNISGNSAYFYNNQLYIFNCLKMIIYVHDFDYNNITFKLFKIINLDFVNGNIFIKSNNLNNFNYKIQISKNYIYIIQYYCINIFDLDGKYLRYLPGSLNLGFHIDDDNDLIYIINEDNLLIYEHT